MDLLDGIGQRTMRPRYDVKQRTNDRTPAAPDSRKIDCFGQLSTHKDP